MHITDDETSDTESTFHFTDVEGNVDTLPNYSHLDDEDRMEMLLHYLDHVTIYGSDYQWYIQDSVFIDEGFTYKVKEILTKWNEMVDEHEELPDQSDSTVQLILSTGENNMYTITLERTNDGDFHEIKYSFHSGSESLDNILTVYIHNPVYNCSMDFVWGN